MSISQAFLLAIKSLSGSKMRSFLTMLGIIIGVAAVIAIVSLGNGMSGEVVSSFESIGMKNITVMITGRGGNRNVSTSDMQEFVDENPDIIEGMTPQVTVVGTVKKGSTNSTTATIRGVSEAYDSINKKEIVHGRFLSYLDIEDRTRSCVIGTYVRDLFFGTENPLGGTIKINGYPFTVVGVLKETADSEEGTDDDQILMPYTTAEKISFMRVNSYTVAAVDNEAVTDAKAKIESFLYSVLGNSDLYTVIAMAEVVDTINEMLGMISSVLAGIAAISLLVGGIGIMNIMLVSVTERTREIGIRKALGATPWDILSQFVVEAITTSAVGGVIGIILGALAANVLGNALGMSASISVTAIVVAFSVSAGIGIAFGYFPARKAANMNPIDALRYD